MRAFLPHSLTHALDVKPLHLELGPDVRRKVVVLVNLGVGRTDADEAATFAALPCADKFLRCESTDAAQQHPPPAWLHSRIHTVAYQLVSNCVPSFSGPPVLQAGGGPPHLHRESPKITSSLLLLSWTAQCEEKMGSRVAIGFDVERVGTVAINGRATHKTAQ